MQRRACLLSWKLFCGGFHSVAEVPSGRRDLLCADLGQSAGVGERPHAPAFRVEFLRLHEIADLAGDGRPIAAGNRGDAVARGADEKDFVGFRQQCVDPLGPHAQAATATGRFVDHSRERGNVHINTG